MANEFDKFDEPQSGNAFDKFDKPAEKPFGQKVMEYGVTPALEIAGGVGGSLLGGIGGTAVGPVGTALGTAAGAGTGYALGKKIGELGEEALGYRQSPTAKEAMQRSAKDVLEGAESEVFGQGIGKGLQKGLGAASKVAEFGKSFKEPEKIAEVKDLAQVGEKGYKLLSDKAAKLYEARKGEAEQLYDRAFDVARNAQARGEPFATSKAGQQLLAELEQQKRVLAGGKEFEKGQEKVAGINRLIDAIKGTTTGGEKVPLGKGLVSGKLTTKTPSKTTEKDVEAVVEELRFLRDVDAKGKSYEAYAGLSADYKRDLIGRLEKALYSWNKDYQLADEAYKAASRKLDPFRTELMSRALKGEKFNPKDLVASPEKFGETFFSDVNGVRNLKDVMQDDARVASLGKEYVASILANKTPEQMQKWALDNKNVGWLREAGILGPVQEYATKAKTAASRLNILEKLGYAAAAGTVGSAVGLPMYYGIRRTLGL